jgi:membrane associated rhomboid family serine protease
MEDRPTAFSAMPRPGRALRVVLGLIATVGLLAALVVNWVPGGEAGGKIFLALVATPEQVLRGQVWRVLTAPLLTNPSSLSHLLFSLLGLYFLSTDLETRWGSGRFVRFLVLSVLGGTVLALAFDGLLPQGPGFGVFHPRFMFGPGAAIAATAVAWARENAERQVRLFFFLPVSGKALLWITIGFCALALLYTEQVPEGAVAPFGGVIVGLLFGGTPSPMRAVWLRVRLWGLRRSGAPRLDIDLGDRKADKPRRGGPPLRVLHGGLDAELEKRKPPKDKRYLN